MKKLLLLCLGALASVSWAQEVGSAGRLLQNEDRQNKQARAVMGRGGISVNIDWEYDYNGGYAEVFIRIPERGRFTVSIGDQEITSTTGMYRFFDLTATPQPLSIWQGRTLIYRVTINPRDNTRMVMDFFVKVISTTSLKCTRMKLLIKINSLSSALKKILSHLPPSK